MNDQQLYEMEMARDDDEASPEAKQALARKSHSTLFEAERRHTVNQRRASGVDYRLTLSHQLYEGQRDSNGNETFDRKVEMPRQNARAYFNISRQITNDGAAQLGDLLFPNDDRNYGLNPGAIAKPPLPLQAEPAVDSKGEPLLDENGQQLTNIQAHNRRVQRATAKTARMFTKIDTSLIAAKYPKKARQVIQDAGRLGTGILKGPLPMRDSKGRWAKKTGAKYGKLKSEDLQPDVAVVSPFDFFPDGSAVSCETAIFFWERSYMTPAALEKATKTMGFSADAVKALLIGKPQVEEDSTEDTREEAKQIQTGEKLSDGRFVVWERRGSVSRECLEAYDVEAPNGDSYFDCVLYMCQGEILKVTPTPYENDESVYSVFCWDEDPLGIFGYGIPWLIQDPQRTYVASWRMALDNGNLSSMPQIVIDQKQVTAADGKNELVGGKVWLRTGEVYSNEATRSPFEVHQINQNLSELWAMMDRAVEDAYELSGVTRVEKAQGGLDNAPVTLGATQIVQNNSSVSRRALARRWDDEVTLGLIGRFYDYFMQFDLDEDIKAHMVVEPRGSSVLLAKEAQAQNFMRLFEMTGGGAVEGVKTLPLLRAIAGVMQVPEGRFIETEDEEAARIQAQQEQGDVMSPEQQIEAQKMEVEEARIELEQAELQRKAQKDQMDFQIESAKIQLQELTASADFNDRAQARADKLQESLMKFQADSEREMNKIVLTESTKRDTAAAKINAEQPAKEAAATAAIMNAETKQTELANKMATGQEGI
ncbi:MAG: hypothetical protein HRU11_12610 [Parvularculaceae bacterium]|nr:hypothetical protein [Parvularculaceae bacterium]